MSFIQDFITCKLICHDDSQKGGQSPQVMVLKQAFVDVQRLLHCMETQVEFMFLRNFRHFIINEDRSQYMGKTTVIF